MKLEQCIPNFIKINRIWNSLFKFNLDFHECNFYPLVVKFIFSCKYQFR